MVTNKLTVLHQYCSHGITTSNGVNIKWKLKVGQCQHPYDASISFQRIKRFLLFTSPLKGFLHASKGMQRRCNEREFVYYLPPIINKSQESSYFCCRCRVRPIYNYINFGRINLQLSSSYNMTQLH